MAEPVASLDAELTAGSRAKPQAAPEVGPHLRARREELGLSVREVARRVGVSASLVSQIERGRINPSVSTLYALVSELGLSMHDVFGSPDNSGGARSRPSEGPVTHAGGRALLNLASGVAWERLTAEPEAGVDFLKVIYAPGSASCPDDALIRHMGSEFGFVTSGRLGVQLAFDSYELKPGDAISFDSALPHRLYAIGDEPAEAIWVVVGRAGDGRAAGVGFAQ
jgi:transcriptional regulator with XRE-family HTH domain